MMHIRRVPIMCRVNIPFPQPLQGVMVVIIRTEAHKIIETFECEDDSLLIFPDEFRLPFVY